MVKKIFEAQIYFAGGKWIGQFRPRGGRRWRPFNPDVFMDGIEHTRFFLGEQTDKTRTINTIFTIIGETEDAGTLG